MGQGQSEIALSEISAAAQSGGWVCLKNLHLVTHWLPVLEKHINLLMSADWEVGEVAAEEGRRLHPHFRLWLTTEPHDNFPSTLLQSCLKVAYEVKLSALFVNYFRYTNRSSALKVDRSSLCLQSQLQRLHRFPRSCIMIQGYCFTFVSISKINFRIHFQ